VTERLKLPPTAMVVLADGWVTIEGTLMLLPLLEELELDEELDELELLEELLEELELLELLLEDELLEELEVLFLLLSPPPQAVSTKQNASVEQSLMKR
jgi:hypothetical protein